MIYSLKGKVAFKKGNLIGFEVGGVGYKVLVPPRLAARLPSVGQAAKIFTHLSVREDGWELFGFSDEEALGVFEMLISVSGVGPRIALGVLNDSAPDKILTAIAQGKSEFLEKSSGIGRRLASRIVLELGEKVKTGGDSAFLEIEDADRDLRAALSGLGYKEREINRVLPKIDSKLTSVSDRLRDALRKIQ